MKITFLGDLMLDKSTLSTFKRENGFCFDEAFSTLKVENASSDYVVANLETPVAGEKLLYTKERYCFNSPLEFAKSIKESGVDLVTTANNHCLDRGVEGLFNTIDNLDSIQFNHTGTQKKGGKNYFIKEIDGIKCGFVSFTYGTNAFSNNNYLSKDEKFCVNLFQNQELENPLTRKLYFSQSFIIRALRKICRILHLFQFSKPIYERTEHSFRRIESLKKAINYAKNDGAEYIFALLHAGGQYNQNPTKLTKWICKNAFLFGADFVIANHEHVIHGFDKKLLNKNKFCFYSLGNCFSSSGVTVEPFDKFSNYSASISIKISRGGDKSIV